MKTLALATLLALTQQSDTFTGTLAFDTKDQVPCERVEIVDLTIVTDNKTRFGIHIVFRCLDKKMSM